MAMNRQVRRKVINEVLKNRDKAMAKPQYGFGIVITNRIVSFMFWKWAWVPYDRRLK